MWKKVDGFFERSVAFLSTFISLRPIHYLLFCIQKILKLSFLSGASITELQGLNSKKPLIFQLNQRQEFLEIRICVYLSNSTRYIFEELLMFGETFQLLRINHCRYNSVSKVSNAISISWLICIRTNNVFMFSKT